MSVDSPRLGVQFGQVDYLTRKSVVQQYGSVGVWLGSSHFPRLGAIGVRCTNPLDRREVTEAFTDLGLLDFLPKEGELRPADIDEALKAAGTPQELKQRARDFLQSVANKSLVNQGRRI